MNRRANAVTLMQATQGSPALARLVDLSKESVSRLKAVESMIPTNLFSAITAGPIEGPVWCLIVQSNAAAAKLRQLLPGLQAHLQSRGWEVTSIRLKIQMDPKR